MTNPGLPPQLSKSVRELTQERIRQLKENLDDLLADVDDALGRHPEKDDVPRSRQSFNHHTAA